MCHLCSPPQAGTTCSTLKIRENIRLISQNYYKIKQSTYKLHGSLDQIVPFKFFEMKQLFFFTSSHTRADDMLLVFT